jgi:hypothetical protein
MKLSWCVAFLMSLLAMFGLTRADAVCPKGFEKHEKGCTAKRPVHGECPSGSRFDVNSNLCIYKQ